MKERNNKSKIVTTCPKMFDVVKIKGDTDYFKTINKRFQALFQFYIDGASFIDNDPNWHYFVCYMDHKVAGYTSVLEDIRIMSTSGGKAVYNSKVLLSQFIVLPSYQGLGLGSTLLKSVYDYYLN